MGNSAINYDAKAVLQAYIEGFNNGDSQAIIDLFAADAVIDDPVGSPLKRGQEIVDWFHAGVEKNARLELDTPIRGSADGRSAAMAFRVYSLNDKGDAVTIRSLDTIELGDHGLIKVLKGYWGPEDVIE